MNTLLSRLVSVLRGNAASDSDLQRLAPLLGLTCEELIRVRTDPLLSYRPFTIRKPGGGKRRIAAPSGPLKLLQRRFLHGYLAQQRIHEAATAFRTGHSIATHARRHLGQAIVLTVDLKDFFESTAVLRRVRRCLRSLGWHGESLDILMRLCVYQGGLPQGAPTSPALSNLVNLPLDAGLSEVAGSQGGRYSRYCDDLAFSWPGDAEPPAFRQQVEDRLGHFGYQIQLLKGWRLQRAEEHPQITGLVLDGRRLRLPAIILERIRRLRPWWWGRSDAERAQAAGYRGLQRMLK